MSATLYYSLFSLLLMVVVIRTSSGLRQVAFFLGRGRPTKLIMSSSSWPMLEVEQKFAIADQVAIREKLQQMGMKPIKERQIIDWYFDLDPPVLSPRDLWLRYREVKGQQGQWEL